MIQGTKVWVMTVWGVVPPGVPDHMVEAATISSVAISGNMLPYVKQISVTLETKSPDEMAAAGAGLIVRPH